MLLLFYKHAEEPSEKSIPSHNKSNSIKSLQMMSTNEQRTENGWNHKVAHILPEMLMLNERPRKHEEPAEARMLSRLLLLNQKSKNQT